MKFSEAKNNRGYALIATIIIAFIVLAAVVQFWTWMRLGVKGNVHNLARQKALENADAGLEVAIQYLRTPAATNSTNPGGIPPGTATPLPAALDPNILCTLTLTRESGNQANIDIYATGYYLLGDGLVTYNGQ